MGTPAARTGWEDSDSVLDYNFFYQSFNLLFSVREGGQVIDVHEGNLGTDIIPEAVEFFRIFFSINSYGIGGPSLLCPAGGGLCHLYEDGGNRRFHPGVAGGFLPVLAFYPSGHDGQGTDLDHSLRPPSRWRSFWEALDFPISLSCPKVSISSWPSAGRISRLFFPWKAIWSLCSS